MLEPMIWHTIDKLHEDNFRALVFNPDQMERPVYEARVNKNGGHYDPTYHEWFTTGATHFMLLPKPPPKD